MIPYAIVQGYIEAVMPSVSVIKQDQDSAKPPSLPYVAWTEISSTEQGIANIQHGLVGSVFTENIDVPITETVQVTFCSKTEKQALNEGITGHKTAYLLAAEFLTRIHGTTAKVYQYENNIALMDTRDFSSFSKFLGDIHELRVPVEIILSYVNNHQETANSIDISSINITTTLEGI